MTGLGNNGSPSEIRVLLMPSSNTSTAQSVGRERDGEGEYRTEGVRWGGEGGGGGGLRFPPKTTPAFEEINNQEQLRWSLESSIY